jgi:hypothetical protein
VYSLKFFKDEYNQSFKEWAVRTGYLSYFSPATVPLPEGISLNPYGWLPAPTTTELIFPLLTIRPNEKRTIYWVAEEIITNSTSPMRLSLEWNTDFDINTGTFNPDAWMNVAGYTVTSSKDMKMGGHTMLKTGQGEAIRLRCFPEGGNNNNDWYFKFVAIDLPWID